MTLPALAILAFTIVGVLGVLPSLATADLNWCYPHMTPDSWDWLANGIFWSGAPIAASFRPPGLPLVMALLHRVSALPLLPYLNFALLGLTAFLLHRLVRLRHSPLVAAIAVLLFVSNGSLFGYTRFVMAEVWTLPFLVGSALAFVRAAEKPRSYLLCTGLLSASFLFHYAGAVVGVGLGLAALSYRRNDLSTRWPWLSVAIAAPLPFAWMLVRALHDRTSERVHVIEGLVRPTFDNLWYYAVVATALVGLAAVPVYLAGFIRLFPGQGRRMSPWAQSVLFPLFSLALFFALAYSWADKRFLYYLFPFAVAVAAEGIAVLIAWGSRGRSRAVCATVCLAIVLLWNRIPYPAQSHRLLALSPRDFVDLAGGPRTAQLLSTSPSWSLSLLATDGFLGFSRPPAGCQSPAEWTASTDLRNFLDERLPPAEPVAFAGRGDDSTAYWVSTNRLAITLQRPVVKPGSPQYVIRRLDEPDPRAMASVGPFEVFDLKAIAEMPEPATKPNPPHRKRKQHRQRLDPSGGLPPRR